MTSVPGLPTKLNEPCLTAGCGKSALLADAYRGLCMSCYSAAKKAVEKKITTWEELERLDMVKSKEEASPFLAALRAKQAEGPRDKDIPY